MNSIRFIARLDIKGDKLIKGIHLEGVQAIGDPHEHAYRYYEQGMDELLLMDAVASLYGRNHLNGIITYICQDVFTPITVGGGLRSLEDVNAALRAGADKTAINTAVVHDPGLITRIAEVYGSQCMVLQIDAKRQRDGRWEAYIDGGRERTGLDVVEWAQKAVSLGAGEILLTSVDNEGAKLGFDIELCKAINSCVDVPVIASGGMGVPGHAIDLYRQSGIEAIAMANILHVQKKSIKDIKMEACMHGLPVRFE